MNTTNRYVLGIDLGTTNTLCAIWCEGEHPRIVPIRQPISNLSLFEAQPLLPSAVLLADGAAYVGEYPKYLARLGDRNSTVFTSIKREMGTQWVQRHEGRSWTPEQLSACVLRSVWDGIRLPRDAEPNGIHLPADAPPPERVVITVPAGFGIDQRRATLRAAWLAGFNPATTDLFDEPTAALLHHTRHSHAKAWVEPKRLMVLDIGGGTLDVSCLTLEQRGPVLHADVLGRSRFNELAGDDFDLNVAGLLLERFQQERRQSVAGFREDRLRQLFAQLVAQGERAKVTLCEKAVGREGAEHQHLWADVEVMSGTDLYWKSRVTMADLAQALRPFFVRDRNLDTAARLAGFTFYAAIDECYESLIGTTDPKQAPDFVYLAGGSSGLPFLRTVVQNYFADVFKRPIAPEPVNRPMEAVALGAAWYAGARAQLANAGSVELTQRMHEGVYLVTRSGKLVPFAEPNDKLPVLRRVPYDFEVDGSERLELDLVAGRGPGDLRMQPLGRWVVTLNGFVSRRDTVRLTVAVDENRNCEVRCSATVRGEELQGKMAFNNGHEPWAEAHLGPPLPPVNTVRRGAL